MTRESAQMVFNYAIPVSDFLSDSVQLDTASIQNILRTHFEQRGVSGMVFVVQTSHFVLIVG